MDILKNINGKEWISNIQNLATRRRAQYPRMYLIMDFVDQEGSLSGLGFCTTRCVDEKVGRKVAALKIST